MAEGASGADRTVAAAFFANAVLAGGNAVAIRFSNRELDPLWGAGLRFVVAAALMGLLMAAMRLAVPRGRALMGAVLYGLFQFAGAFGLAYYALVEIRAGLGQTVLALVPLATLLLAVVQRQERLHGAAIVGAVLGVGGVLLMTSAPLREDVAIWSLVAVLGSVLCFAQAAIVLRVYPQVHAVSTNAVAMAVGAVVLVAAAAMSGESFVLPDRRATWVALGYVAGVGSVVVFALYVYVLHHWEASRASYVMVLIPFVTVLLSAWLDDEPIQGGLVVGGALVLAGTYVGALRPARRRTRAPATAR